MYAALYVFPVGKRRLLPQHARRKSRRHRSGTPAALDISGQVLMGPDGRAEHYLLRATSLVQPLFPRFSRRVSRCVKNCDDLYQAVANGIDDQGKPRTTRSLTPV